MASNIPPTTRQVALRRNGKLHILTLTKFSGETGALGPILQDLDWATATDDSIFNLLKTKTEFTFVTVHKEIVNE